MKKSMIDLRKALASKEATDVLKKTASGSENLMESIISCIQVGASIGEVMGSLADVFGEYQGDF